MLGNFRVKPLKMTCDSILLMLIWGLIHAAFRIFEPSRVFLRISIRQSSVKKNTEIARTNDKSNKHYILPSFRRATSGVAAMVLDPFGYPIDVTNGAYFGVG